MNAKRPRVAVFGVGGVGGYFGARLASVGVDVVFIARGEHLAAIRSSGLRVTSVLGDVLVSPAEATDSPAAAGPVDAVLLGVKTWQVAAAAAALGPLLGPDTCVVPLQNGVDTSEVLAAAIGAEHVVGGTCGGFCFIDGPGHIRHIGGVTFIKFGELDGRRSGRVEILRAAFERARVDVEVPADIRVAQWEKLALVVPFGGIGAVARAPIGVLRSVPQTRQLLERGIAEIRDVASARGIRLPNDIVARTLATLDSVTPSGTSSLQRDIGDGKRSELDAWTGAVVRLGAAAGVPTPVHDFIYASLLPLELRARRELAFD
jgi:2-dehydropantoate 2-reductase